MQNLHKQEATFTSGKITHSSPFSFSSRTSVCIALWRRPHCHSHSTECFARICVSGLILDPEVPAASAFTSPFKPSEDEPIRAAATFGLTRTPTVNRSGLSRTHTLGHRLRRIGKNFFKPFELHHKSTADTTNSGAAAAARTRSGTETRTPMMEKAMVTTHDILREPKPIFLTDFLRSDKSDTVSLPFKLIIEQSHQSTRRNMPYLRQSWNRIDFLSILCFWASFALATGGIEKGSTLYIGIFRALSVLKVSRLLAVTSGTTVRAQRLCLALLFNCFQTIMRSLKTARPLLTSVAYFVLFAMLLFSCVDLCRQGVQTLTQFNQGHRNRIIQGFVPSLLFLATHSGRGGNPNFRPGMWRVDRSGDIEDDALHQERRDGG